MLRTALFVFLASTLIAGFVACPGPQEQAEQPAEQPAAQPEMSPDEMVTYIQSKCICAQCPSWTEECTKAGEKGGYCALGKTANITEEKGCVCGDCPITKEKGLKWGYYCTRGSAKEMMAKEAMEQPAGGQ